MVHKVKRESNSWLIEVRDSNRPDNEPLQLYGYYTSGPRTLRQICTSEEEATKLGECACTLLDRYPGRLNEHSWLNRTSPSICRLTIEFLALDLWQPKFDYSQINDKEFKPEASSSRRLGQFHRANAEVTAPKGKAWASTLVHQLRLCYDGIDVHEPKYDYKMVMDVRGIRWDRVATIEKVPNNFIHRIRGVRKWPSELTQEQKAGRKSTVPSCPFFLSLNETHADEIIAPLVTRLFNMVEYKMFGKIGGIRQLFAYCSSLIDPYRTVSVSDEETNADWKKWMKSTGSKPVLRGPFGGSPFCTIHRQPVPGRPLHRIDRSLTAASSTAVWLPTIDIASSSALEIAFVLGQMHMVLQMGRYSPEAWQAGVVASALIETKNIPRDEILEALCWCETEDDRINNVHPCAICWALRFCRDLLELEDGRRVCMTHSLVPEENFQVYARVEKPARTATSSKSTARPTGRQGVKPPPTSKTPKVRIPARLEQLHRRLWIRVKDDPVLREECRRVITSLTNFDTDEPYWQDLYDGERTFRSTTFQERVQSAVSGRRAIHPLEPTIEAPMPFVKIEDKLVYHHTSNIGLATAFMNNAKRDWPASIVAVIRAAARAALSEKNGTPPDLSLRQAIHTAFDHAHRLSLLMPYTQAKRLAMSELSDRDLDRLMQAWRTGTWSTNLPTTKQAHLLVPMFSGSRRPVRSYLEGTLKEFTIRGGQESKRVAGDPEQVAALTARRRQMKSRSQEWKIEQIQQLQSLVDQIEQDRRINPDELVIPRVDGVPWPFRRDHMLSEADAADMWDWWYFEAAARYLRMADECNFEHDTQESPVTIFCEIIVQWFLCKGGKLRWLRSSSTVY